MIRAGDQILRAGGFADQHAAGIIFLQDLVQGIDLRVDLVRRDHVSGINQHHLVPIALDQGQHILRDNALRNPRAQQAVDADDVFHAVHLLHLVRHVLDVLLGDVTVHQQQMGCRHIKGGFQLFVGDHRGQFLGHDLAHIIVDTHVPVPVESGNDHDQQDHGQHLVMLHHEPSDAAHIRQQGLMAGFLDSAIQQSDDAGQQHHRAQHAHHDTLTHDNAQIAAQGEAHEADADEARHRGQAGAQDRGEGQVDGFRHGLVLVLKVGFLLLVAVPQEDGVIQRDAQLQHRGHSLGDIADFSEKIVAAHVPQDADADAQQEDNRQQEGIQRDHQHYRAQGYRDAHINGFLLLHHLLGVGYDGGQAADEAFLSGNFPHFLDGFHGFFGGRSLVEENSAQHAVSPIEQFSNVLRDNLQRKQPLRHGSVSDDGIHMWNLLQSVFHVRLLRNAHALRHQQGKGSLAKVFQQNFLPLDCFQILRQVVQQIIFRLRGRHAQHGWDHQQQADDDHQPPVAYQSFGESFHYASSSTKQSVDKLNDSDLIAKTIEINSQFEYQSPVNQQDSCRKRLLNKKHRNCTESGAEHGGTGQKRRPPGAADKEAADAGADGADAAKAGEGNHGHGAD